MEIDEEPGEAHGALAHILFGYGHDVRAAENEYRRALEFNPNNPVALRDYAFYLLYTGRPDESLRQIQLAMDLDPLSSDTGHGMARVYMGRRDFNSAIAQSQRIIDRDPTNYLAYDMLGSLLTAKHLYPEAELTGSGRARLPSICGSFCDL